MNKIIYVKRLIWICAILSFIGLTSCDKQATPVFDIEQIDVIEFASTGGERAISFRTDIDDWTYRLEYGNWMTSKVTNEGLLLNATANSDYAERVANLLITSAKHPSINTRIKIIQTPRPIPYIFDRTNDASIGAIGLADFRNSGHLDVIFTGTNALFTAVRGELYFNEGNRIFQPASGSAPSPGIQGTYRFADIDGDGNIDIFYAGHGTNNNVSINHGLLLGNGDGTFAPNADIPLLSGGFRAVEVADFDNNGLLDYFLIRNGSGQVGIWFQQTDGSFVRSPTAAFPTVNFNQDLNTILLDYNNDGFIDILVQAGWDSLVSGRGCVVYRNNGNGTFTIATQSNIVKRGFGSASFGDVNGDGWGDLLINGDGGSSNFQYDLYQNNAGTFSLAKSLSPFSQKATGSGSKFVDWDNDGKLDIILGGQTNTADAYQIASRKTAFFKGTNGSDFSFQQEDIALPDVFRPVYEIADMDDDGRSDLLFMGLMDPSMNNNTGIIWNTSSNVNTPPMAPSNLTNTVTGSTIVLKWDAATDAQTPAASLTYNIVLRNKTTGKWMYNPLADTASGKRKVTGHGNAFFNKQWTLKNLPAGNYEWSVQAVDTNYVGGKFAAFSSFTVN